MVPCRPSFNTTRRYWSGFPPLWAGSSSGDLRASYEAEQQAALQRIGDTPLSQIPSLAAWRSAFRRFGIDPTKYRSSAEALARRLTKTGQIPSIDALVDLGNLVSIRYSVPLAIFDLREVRGSVTVRFADGSERFTPLGASEIECPEAGEVIFRDDDRLVLSRRWCWRQSEQSAARLDTTDALVTIEAHHAAALADVRAALDDLEAILLSVAGGGLTSGMLTVEHPVLASI